VGVKPFPYAPKMKPADYSKDALIEQPAMQWLGKLLWETASCLHEQV
jgi:hypothetical protein